MVGGRVLFVNLEFFIFWFRCGTLFLDSVSTLLFFLKFNLNLFNLPSSSGHFIGVGPQYSFFRGKNPSQELVYVISSTEPGSFHFIAWTHG